MLFSINRRHIINSEISNYIKEQTNKYIENIKKRGSPGVYQLNNILIPFVSLLSLLVGYNLYKLIDK
jgi:hypothetical protein